MKRNTWQRDAVKDALNKREDFVSAQKLHTQLKLEGSTIGLATVYRTLTDLVASKEADALQSPDGENLYRACVSEGHHHHLICRSCGQTQEIKAEAVEAWAAQVAAEHGYTQPRHIVDVFGLCAQCSR
jgi:Fur family transcriptional regulator, ferric uptake regulator